MNANKPENQISQSEMNELEASLSRFDAFKSSLKPNPEALRFALSRIPVTTPSPSRRTVRVRSFVAFIATASLALVLFFAPQSAAPSSLSQSLLAEERAVDAASVQMDETTAIAVDQADLMLSRLADDITL